jgi:hypothetical protein
VLPESLCLTSCRPSHDSRNAQNRIRKQNSRVAFREISRLHRAKGDAEQSLAPRRRAPTRQCMYTTSAAALLAHVCLKLRCPRGTLLTAVSAPQLPLQW